jgi:hypothetical protein
MALNAPQRRIVLVLGTLDEQEPGRPVADTVIARETGLLLNDVRDWLLTLESKNLVSLVRTDTYVCILEPEGRIEARRQRDFASPNVLPTDDRHANRQPRNLPALFAVIAGCALGFLAAIAIVYCVPQTTDGMMYAFLLICLAGSATLLAYFVVRHLTDVSPEISFSDRTIILKLFMLEDGEYSHLGFQQRYISHPLRLSSRRLRRLFTRLAGSR